MVIAKAMMSKDKEVPPDWDRNDRRAGRENIRQGLARRREKKLKKGDEFDINEISPRQARLCHLISLGMANNTAYFEAGYGSPTTTPAAASTAANSILREPKVKAYMQHLREASFLANVLTLAEKRSFLADVVRTPVGSIGKDDKLAQVLRFHKGEMTEIRMPDKLKAVELDAKLAGELAENQVAVNIGMQLVNDRLAAIDLPRDAVTIVNPEAG